jgi:hypothetical protein
MRDDEGHDEGLWRPYLRSGGSGGLTRSGGLTCGWFRCRACNAGLTWDRGTLKKEGPLDRGTLTKEGHLDRGTLEKESTFSLRGEPMHIISFAFTVEHRFVPSRATRAVHARDPSHARRSRHRPPSCRCWPRTRNRGSSCPAKPGRG